MDEEKLKSLKLSAWNDLAEREKYYVYKRGEDENKASVVGDNITQVLFYKGELKID